MNISTTVAAQGQAEAPHNLAHYQVVLQAEAETVPVAKACLKKQVEQLVASVEAMKTNLGIEFVKDSLRTNTNVQQKHEWINNKNEFRGYTITYQMTFVIDDLDKISQVYDALTNLDKVQVTSPWFSLKNRDKLNKKALKKAFENVQSRFEEECAVLGLEATDFEVGTWEVSYSDSQRSDRVSKGMRAMAAGAPGAPRGGRASAESVEIASAQSDSGEDTLLEINPGNATVTVNLEVGYVRRANAIAVPAVRARVVATGNSTDNATV